MTKKKKKGRRKEETKGKEQEAWMQKNKTNKNKRPTNDPNEKPTFIKRIHTMKR
jgi:hypothetical protein